MIRAIDPVVIRLCDGKEYHFFLSHAALRRAARRLPADLKGSATGLLVDLWAPVFYEACDEKTQITFDEFEEILPGDPEFLANKFNDLRAHARSMCENPIMASGSLPSPTGSDIGPSDGNSSG